MVNEEGLRDALISLVKDCRSLYEMIASTQAEVAALRETVRALDPTFSDNFQQRKEYFQSLASEQYPTALRYYEKIIQKLEGGYVC
jgi:hypothetical protein